MKCHFCVLWFTYEVGKMPFGYKLPDGSAPSDKSVQHIKQKRIFCPNCEKVYCMECKLEPYHMGMNCFEYKQSLLTKKCRFCVIKIEEKD